MENRKKITIKKGLDIPLKGKPEQQVRKEVLPLRVAVGGIDYPALRPKLSVNVGDSVKKGDTLFIDKKNEKVKFTSPVCGKVVEINRGFKRRLESVVIEVSGTEELEFETFTKEEINLLPKEKVLKGLLNSGLWTGLRQRPYSQVANPDETPHSIFITAIDTNPLAPSIKVILEGNNDSFQSGVQALSKLTNGKTYICKSKEAGLWDFKSPDIEVIEFAGPHPAGNPGTHIHFLDPVSKNKTVWHIGIQDVIAIGKFFVTGKIPNERIIALGGPGVLNPKLIKTLMGADINTIVEGELVSDHELRIISGSLLNGRESVGKTIFLGRYHQQISVIKVKLNKKFMGWLYPGFKTYSVKGLFMSKFLFKKEYDLDTDEHGGLRNLYSIGDYERIMPLDILPTFLLRALLSEDIEEAEKLGVLELDEEDLALCSFISAAKIDYGSVLRKNLIRLKKEG